MRALRWISFLATCAIVTLLAYNIGREPLRQEQAAASYHAAALAGGTDLYALHCARCHGAAGEGLGAYRALNQDFIASKPAGELYTVIHYGRYATDMAAFGLDQGGALTATQINDLVVMLQNAEWESVAARVAALGYTPTEEDIRAAQEAAQRTALILGAADADTLALGLGLFEVHCAECHGPAGEGSSDAPQLNNAYVQGMAESQLLEIVGLGVRNTEMEGFRDRLAEGEIAALVQLLRNWGNLDGAAPAGEFVIATAEEIAEVTQTGQAIFEMWCGICHGVRGEGGGIAPSLNDIPALPAEFLVSRIRNGQNAMPPFAESDLSNGEMALVIEYAQASIIGAGLPAYSAEELAQGADLYAAACGECHGPAGEGVPEAGPRITTLPPMRAVEIVNFTRVGSAQTPAIPSSQVSDAELRLIVAYIHSLSE